MSGLMVRSRESYCWLDSGNKAALHGRQRFSDVRAQNGSYARRTLSASELDTLMSAGAKPVAAGMLLTMHNGRFYMVEDHKRPDGKMLYPDLECDPACGQDQAAVLTVCWPFRLENGDIALPLNGRLLPKLDRYLATPERLTVLVNQGGRCRRMQRIQ